jgi:hypothetical protein
MITSCTIHLTENFPRNNWSYYYVNNSSHLVVISSRVDTNLTQFKLDSIINKGDTVRLFNMNWLEPFGVGASVTIIFDPVKCITYGDSLRIVPATDIRSHGAYKMITTDNQTYKGYFTITDSLYGVATNCP